jgi:hypothetical protein
MRDFHMNFKEANRFPLVQAFALAAWNNETNPWCAVERVGDGYIAQEAWKRRNV